MSTEKDNASREEDKSDCQRQGAGQRMIEQNGQRSAVSPDKQSGFYINLLTETTNNTAILKVDALSLSLCVLHISLSLSLCRTQKHTQSKTFHTNRFYSSTPLLNRNVFLHITKIRGTVPFLSFIIPINLSTRMDHLCSLLLMVKKLQYVSLHIFVPFSNFLYAQSDKSFKNSINYQLLE